MGKIVKAVKPFIYKNNSNFKLAVYNAWCELGGKYVADRKFEHLYESLSYHLHLPTFFRIKSKQGFASLKQPICRLILFRIILAMRLFLCFGIVGQVISVKCRIG